jgi:hypothetical protein
VPPSPLGANTKMQSPTGAKERRRKARQESGDGSSMNGSSYFYDSTASWASWGSSPQPSYSPSIRTSPDGQGNVVNPLAMAGMMIATGELDRLSTMANYPRDAAPVRRPPKEMGVISDSTIRATPVRAATQRIPACRAVSPSNMILKSDNRLCSTSTQVQDTPKSKEMRASSRLHEVLMPHYQWSWPATASCGNVEAERPPYPAPEEAGYEGEEDSSTLGDANHHKRVEDIQPPSDSNIIKPSNQVIRRPCSQSTSSQIHDSRRTEGHNMTNRSPRHSITAVLGEVVSGICRKRSDLRDNSADNHAAQGSEHPPPAFRRKSHADRRSSSLGYRPPVNIDWARIQITPYESGWITLEELREDRPPQIWETWSIIYDNPQAQKIPEALLPLIETMNIPIATFWTKEPTPSNGTTQSFHPNMVDQWEDYARRVLRRNTSGTVIVREKSNSQDSKNEENKKEVVV